MSSYTLSQALDLAVDKLPLLRRRAANRRLSRPKIREAALDDLAIKLCDDCDCCSILGPAFVAALESGSIDTKFELDLDQLERLLQIIIEYLPQILEIIMKLFA